ncbi:MAG: citrate/2-methylcitrate synthase [Candidatus Thorarchaeota archaeon]|jgi:citrate synthase
MKERTLNRNPISEIDPEKGRLYFRGVDAVKLADTRDYESVLYHLTYGLLPDESEKNNLQESMRNLRLLKPSVSERIQELHSEQSSGILIELAKWIEDYRTDYSLSLYDTLLTIVVSTPIAITTHWRKEHSESPVKPEEDLNHAANLLWMLKGDHSSLEDISDFETCLILHMDDPDNPSLTALLDSLSRGDSLSQAFMAAFSKHLEPIHHGAGHETMKMIESIHEVSDVRETLEKRLDRGHKIYGIGHRIYQTIDPRAGVLRRILEKRSRASSNELLYTIISEVAKVGPEILQERKGIRVHPNVDLYNAAVYTTFGIPHSLNTDLFAVSRVAGWMAHVIQLQEKNMIDKKTFL